MKLKFNWHKKPLECFKWTKQTLQSSSGSLEFSLYHQHTHTQSKQTLPTRNALFVFKIRCAVSHFKPSNFPPRQHCAAANGQECVVSRTHPVLRLLQSLWCIFSKDLWHKCQKHRASISSRQHTLFPHFLSVCAWLSLALLDLC